MAHNPFNDLYVDSVDEVTRDTQRYWEIASAICNRDLRRQQMHLAHRLQKKHRLAHVKEESHAHRPSRDSQEGAA